MRWFVEVSRVGDSTLAERYCVEAKAWQAALQETRKLRGDSGPLSKFSIELLDDGYRAVDPVQKIRYLVNQAPSDAPLQVPPQVNGAAHSALSASTPPGAGPSSPPVAPVITVAPPAPVASARPAVTAAPMPPVATAATMPAAPLGASAGSLSPVSATSAAPSVKKVMGVTLGATNSVPAPSPSAVPAAGGAPRPSPKRSAGSRAPGKAASLEAKAVTQPAASITSPAVPMAHNAAAVAAAVQVTAPAIAPAPALEIVAKPSEALAPGVPEFEMFSSRIQEPTPEAPIAYRELACVVAPGTTRVALEALLRDRLKAAQADFSARPPGQLIQIAIFDHVFDERPQRAPLGTLAWKDSRGEPILGYPAFGEAAPPTTPSLPPSPVVQVNAADPAAAPATPSAATPAPAPVEPAVVASAPAVQPAISAAPQPADAAAAASTTSAVATAGSPAAPEEAEQPVLLQRRSRPDGDRASSPKIAQARRRAGEDLISELFESMHELHFARDIALGADFVLGIVEQVVPCEATLIQVFDINTRNFVVVRGRGGGAERAVLHRTPDSEPLTAEIMRRDRTRAYRTEGDARFTTGRWGAIGLPLREVLCGAVRQGGRYLGMIELANPLGGAPFHETEINALDYICEQFADFVASRPVVLDPDVILGR